MKPYRAFGGSTVVLAAACIISLFAAACGSERGEDASHGSATRANDVAKDSGDGAPPAPPLDSGLGGLVPKTGRKKRVPGRDRDPA